MKIASCLFFGVCLLAFQWTTSVEAFFNITSDILRTNQSFNLTVGDSCNATYTVDFGDGTTDSLTSSQKIMSHSYASPGNYNIQLQSGSAPLGCQSASKSVAVRDPIQNMTSFVSSTLCRRGETLNVSVQVLPDTQHTVFWRLNKTTNWIQGPIECKQLGNNDVYVMVENGVSVLSSECFDEILVVDFDFTSNPEIGAINSTVEFTRTNVIEVPDESNYTFVWEFNGNETIHCPNKTVSKFFSSPNPDPGHLVKLSMFNQQGDMASLEKNIKIYDAIEKPIRVSYPNRTRSYELTEFVVEPHKGHGVMYAWDYGDNSTVQNTTNRTISHMYTSHGEYCVLLVAKNFFSEAILNFKVSVVTPIDGFGFVKNITPVETGYPSNIGIEIRNGSNVNVSINFGDGSEPVWIVNVDDVLDIFVISLWHNYSMAGLYNVTIEARNLLDYLTASSIAQVQDPLGNLTIQQTYYTKCLEVNGTLSVQVSVDGTDPQYFYDFGDQTNLTLRESIGNHSYITHGEYVLNSTAFNFISSVTLNSNVTVCKPVIPLVGLSVSSPATNLSDSVKFTMSLAEGSDFECLFDYGDGSFDFFGRSCYNLTYFADGVTADRTPFMNLKFQAYHNYTEVGRYEVYVNCSNRNSKMNYTMYAVIQKPIKDLELPYISPKILGKNNPITWTMANGTNATFHLEAEGTTINYTSMKTDTGDVFITSASDIVSPGVYLVKLRAQNEVSEAKRSIILIIQKDVTQVSFQTWTTTSDFGSNIHGFGPKKNIFPCEYPVNFTATPDKGTNLTYLWKFDDGTEQNTSESTITHKYDEIEAEYWTNVTVFNLVSKVTMPFRLKTEKSVLGFTITDNSPVKVNRTTTFKLGFTRFGTRPCVQMDMGDGQGLFVFGGNHCQSTAPGFTYEPKADDITEIIHTYTYSTIDEFWVAVIANNTVSNLTHEFKSVTVALSCSFPNATLLDVSPNVTTATEMKRSGHIRIKTDIEVDCDASKTTAFKWEIFSMSKNPVNFQPLAEEKPVPVPGSDQSELYVRETELDFGFYKLVFTVSMEGVEGVSGTAVGYIHVVATKSNDSLQAFVDGGPRKRYKFGRNVTLNAEKSKDADFASLMQASPIFYWLCRNSSEPEFDTSGNVAAIDVMPMPELDGGGIHNSSENRGGCFKTGKGRLANTGSLAILDSRRGMTENGTYVITLVLVTRNPFGKKRAVYKQELVITFGDPPEVEVTCSPSCPPKVNIDQKLALEGTCKVCFGELTFSWLLYRHKELGVDPIDKDNLEPVNHLEEISTTPINSLNLALKEDSLPKDTGFTAFFRAHRLNGQFGEYIHTFVTNSPPENGTCEVEPKMGSAMKTSFTINCSGWADPDQPLIYEFSYINFVQESVFYVSRDPIAPSVVLPMGHESNDFNLTLNIRITDRWGASEVEKMEIKVKPTNFTNGQLRHLISGEDGLLKEALKKGDLQEMVEIINAVGSILNFNGRQAAQRNLTEAEAAEENEAENTRKELRTAILKDMAEFKMSSVGHIKLVASAIDVTTEVESEVETKAQELALYSFKQMASVLGKESHNNVGFMVVKDTVGSVLSGIANVLQSSASLARVDATDSNENITGYTGNSTTGGVVSVKDSARNRTLKLLTIVDDVGNIVMDNMVAGEPASVIQTRDFNLTVKKSLFEKVGGSSISDDYSKFHLPTQDQMGLVYDSNGTQKYSTVQIQMNSIPNNVHTWSNTSRQVNSFTVSLTLKDKNGKLLNTSNFSSYADIYIPRNASQLPEEEEFYVIPTGNKKYIQYHTIQVNSSNYSVHIQVRPRNESIGNLTVLLRYDDRPNTETFDYSWTVPDFSSCSFSNVSRKVSNSSAGSGANNATNSSATNSTQTEEEIVVIDLKRDCVRDPYLVSISNSMVTEKGTYYLAVYYEEPEPETETEEELPTSSPTEARERRDLDIPAACRAAHGRMKRSCVIIPPPPPKPTTPSKQQFGTKPSNEDFQGNTFNSNDTEHYFMRVFSSNCLYWDEKSENWINNGCKVGENTNPELIHCKCNHLTSFASDFIVAPNPIDFDKVFSADLSKNFVVLLVVCLLFGLYLLLVVIARRFDKKDLDKLGATAVRNRAEASFSYLISVHTGVRQNAGTTSTVYIVLSGDEWESTPMPLVDHDRKVFQRGQENNFVITIPRRLGNLTHIRIWHDNYGSNPSWYLSRVSVDDLRTEERWYFICERWLAVEEDDGRVERILPVASEKELTHFQHLFVSKTVRELGDGHLWFSVVTRPANSPFTRVQRVSCCLSLLCCTMVTNAMFYQMGGEGEKSTMIEIGTYEFDLRVFIIGIQASLIVFPVNFALVQIFRNVRPKEVKQKRNTETTEKQEEVFADISRCSSAQTLQNASSETKIIEDKEDNSEKGSNTMKKKKNGLPHGYVYLAWALCFLSSVTSAVFTVFYSLSWGPEISNKWIVAFVTSFFQSIFVIQPLKVILAALLFAIIIKKPMDSGDETSDKKELKGTPGDQETGDDILLDYDENDERYRPPDENFLNTARAHRLKEVRMSEILKEIVTYFLFLMLLLLVAYGNRDPNTYLLRKTLHETFVDLDQLSVDLADAGDVDLFWHWGRETLVPNLYPGVLYNNKSDKYTGFISDRNNYLVGISRLRQARVEKDSCKIVENFQRFFNHCYPEYSFVNEENKDYDVGWKFLNESNTNSRRRRSVEEQFAFRGGDRYLIEFGDSPRIRSRRAIEPVYTSTSGRQQRRKKRPGNTAKNYYVLNSAMLPDGSIISCPSRWVHKSALDLRGYPFWGRMTIYSGGGYSADLGYDYPTALTVIADLHSHNWVDMQTRAVFVEFTVYNANTNLFGIAFLFLEFLPTGGAFPYAHFAVSRLYSYVGPFSHFILACQVLLILFMLYFMYREGKAIYKQRKAYFNGFFNWMEIVMIVCEFAMVVLFLGRLWEVDKNLEELRYNPKDFVSFQYAGAADESLTFIMGILVFLVTLRFLKLFRFNKRMSLLGSTIGECAKPLGSFFISFMLVFFAYAILAYLVFGLDNDKFRNFLTTIETQTSIILGDFDYEELESTNRILGPVYFFTFMYFSVFYLLNMFMAIINDCFADVKSSNDKQKNEYEMVEFILTRFKENLGLNRNRVGTASKSRHSSGFPSSPPFLPSDYKHRDEDVLGSVCSLSDIDDRPPEITTHNVLRRLSELNKLVDEMTTFVDKNDQHDASNDQMLFDILNDMKNDQVEVPYGSITMVQSRL